MMTPMSKAGERLMLTLLLTQVCACGSKTADPGTPPSWIAAYPGTPARAKGSAFVFQTKDQAEKVLDFYERQLEQNGVHKEARGGGDYGGFLVAGDDSHNRNVMIEIRPVNGMSEISVTVVAKK